MPKITAVWVFDGIGNVQLLTQLCQKQCNSQKLVALFHFPLV